MQAKPAISNYQWLRAGVLEWLVGYFSYDFDQPTTPYSSTVAEVLEWLVGYFPYDFDQPTTPHSSTPYQ